MVKILFILLLGLFTLLNASIGTAVMVKGKVEVKRADKILVAEKGFGLEKLDLITTGKRSKAKFLFNDKTVISLGQNSTLDIAKYLFNEENKNEAEFKITKGAFKAITGGIGKIAPNKFKLKTKTATIGILGSTFSGVVDDENAEISCIAGVITVTTKGGSVKLKEGYRTYVRGDKKPSIPEMIPLFIPLPLYITGPSLSSLPVVTGVATPAKAVEKKIIESQPTPVPPKKEDREEAVELSEKAAETIPVIIAAKEDDTNETESTPPADEAEKRFAWITMKQTVSEIVLNHPEIRKQLESYRYEVEGKNIKKAEYLPKLDAKSLIGYKKYNGPNSDFRDDDFKSSESYIRLRQNLFRGFGTLHGVQAQEERVTTAEYSMMESVSAVGLSMIEAHLELLKQFQLFLLADENVEKHELIYTMIEERTKLGAGPASDLEQISGRLALANSNLQVSMNNYEDAFSAYERISGSSVCIDNLKEPYLMDAEPVGSLESAYSDHPALKASQQSVAASKEAYQQSSESFYPWVDFDGKKEWERNWESDYDRDRTELSGMLIASWNLFRGGQDKALQNKSLSALYQESESLRDTERELKVRLQHSWAENRRLDEQMQYLKQHSDFTRKTIASYNDEFRLGRRSLLDLLDIEIEYYRAMTTYESARYDQLIVKYKIIENVGGLPELLDIDINDLRDLERREYETQNDQTSIGRGL
ncbi:MAG: TolC family outer membrane protein [Campylobacterota bacterium]|nr:TolC family outer membrane protein [Campylobacterota bacterium]